jgi:hypothetical protein
VDHADEVAAGESGHGTRVGRVVRC